MLTSNNGDVLLISPRAWRAALAELQEAQASGIQMRRVAVTPPDESPDYDVVSVQGVLLKTVPERYRAYIQATGYDEIAESLAAAAKSAKPTIVVQVNSGGGMVDGIDLAIEAMRSAARAKNVVAVVDGMCCSAAYWIASQADRIDATRFSELGSIGAYSVMYDTSSFAESEGIRAVVSRSGEQKGAGIFGDPITEALQQPQDETVAAIAQMFLRDVLAVRASVDAGAVSTGRSWIAEQARDLGLVDNVVKHTREIVFPRENIKQQQAEDGPTPEHEEDTLMSENMQDAVSVERERVLAITTVFAGDPEFARKHITAGSTLEQAKAEHYDIMLARQQAMAALEEKPIAPVPTSESKQAARGFLAQVREVAEAQGIRISEAAALVAKQDRGAYLAHLGVEE